MTNRDALAAVGAIAILAGVAFKFGWEWALILAGVLGLAIAIGLTVRSA